MDLEIQEIAHHRNGSGGLPFHAVRFRWQPANGAVKENFLATVFAEPGACAVISLDSIAAYGVAVGPNSWRGDDFEYGLRRAISEWEAARARHMMGVT
jgi:hypothetical protein